MTLAETVSYVVHYPWTPLTEVVRHTPLSSPLSQAAALVGSRMSDVCRCANRSRLTRLLSSVKNLAV